MSYGVNRRSFAKAAFFGSVGLVGVAGGATILNTLYPRDPSGSGEILVPTDRVPMPGEPPLYVAEGRFLLVNLRPDEGSDAASPRTASGGLLALSDRCTHLQCEVRWRDDYHVGERASSEWIVCRCHGGVFTKAGVRVFGPPPRSLDTLPLRITPAGDVAVDPLRVREGDNDNPVRAVPWPPA